jgi:hypothetical protein
VATFFVESYVPSLDEATALSLSSQLRAAVEELRQDGRSLQWRGSFALIDEETYLWVLAAPHADAVVEVSLRAGVRCYQVTEALADPYPIGAGDAATGWPRP